MKKYCLFLILIKATLGASFDSSIQLKGIVSKDFKNREFISIKDNLTKNRYVVPLRNVRFLDRKKTKVFVEMTDSEFRSARKKCMNSKSVKKSLCPPEI